MASSQNSSNCVICCWACKVDSGEGENESGCIEPGPYYPSQSPKGNYLLEAQSRDIFILRNIFELEQNQVENYKQKWGSPGNCVKLCGSCKEDVTNLRKIFLKLQEVKREFERTKCAIQEKVQVAEKEDNKKTKSGWEEIFDECRQRVCSRHKGNLPPSEQSATLNDMVVQEEVDDSQSLGEEHVDDVNCSDVPIPIVNSVDDSVNNFTDPRFAYLPACIREEFLSKNKYTFCRRTDIRYKCIDCGRICTTEANLRRHMQSVGHMESCEISATEAASNFTPNKRSVCTWEGCGKTFKYYRDLHKHIERVHKRIDQSICSLCGKIYITKRGMADHIKYVHGKNLNGDSDQSFERVSCTWEGCARTFKTIHSLKLHIKGVHEGARKATCSLCPREFSSSTALTLHMARAHGVGEDEIRVICDLCGKSLLKYTLKKHIQVFHEKILQSKLKCDLCDKGFLQKYHLDLHKARAHNIGDFKCERDGCLKVFFKKEHLEDHIKYSHEGLVDPKTKYCQFCGKGYTKPNRLKLHEEAMHLNKETRPFPCPVPECNKKFPTMTYCKQHVRKYHTAVKWSKKKKVKNSSEVNPSPMSEVKDEVN